MLPRLALACVPIAPTAPENPDVPPAPNPPPPVAALCVTTCSIQREVDIVDL